MLEFEPGLFIWTTVSFGILVLLLYKVALPPILSLLAERERTIADSLSEAAANRKMAEELNEEYKKKLAAVNQTADRILDEAKKEGENLRAEVLERAQKQAELIAARTQQDLSREKEKILHEVKSVTAELVAAAAGVVLRKTVKAEDNKRLIEESIKEAAR